MKASPLVADRAALWRYSVQAQARAGQAARLAVSAQPQAALSGQLRAAVSARVAPVRQPARSARRGAARQAPNAPVFPARSHARGPQSGCAAPRAAAQILRAAWHGPPHPPARAASRARPVAALPHSVAEWNKPITANGGRPRPDTSHIGRAAWTGFAHPGAGRRVQKPVAEARTAHRDTTLSWPCFSDRPSGSLSRPEIPRPYTARPVPAGDLGRAQHHG